MNVQNVKTEIKNTHVGNDVESIMRNVSNALITGFTRGKGYHDESYESMISLSSEISDSVKRELDIKLIALSDRNEDGYYNNQHIFKESIGKKAILVLSDDTEKECTIIGVDTSNLNEYSYHIEPVVSIIIEDNGNLVNKIVSLNNSILYVYKDSERTSDFSITL